MSETQTPADQDALATAVRQAFADDLAIYPVGGGTSLDFGLTATRAGMNLSLAKLNRVIDYPARDMTITVEAGITMAEMTKTLAAERQRLPIDAPMPEQATLGGVIATNFSGPLRFGHGTVRDYVIGITAVDGRGTTFHGGGRVVKNVAGYDFCKLLTGSLGTLAIITQVTLKVKPIPEQTRLVACRVKSDTQAAELLAGMASSPVTPAAIELVTGPIWQADPALERLDAADFGHLIVALEGTSPEVEWMQTTLQTQWRAETVEALPIADEQADGLWRRLRDFPRGEAALSIKAAVPASRTVDMIRSISAAAPNCSVQAHAGNGVLLARFPAFPAGGVSRIVIGQLQPAAANAGGHLIALSANLPGEITRQAVWGGTTPAGMLMEEVKRQFDPKNLLNPGRFVYGVL